MIKTSNIAFSYDEKATFTFPDVNCEAGETLLITGDSGKGKTTLLHMLGGILRPKSGEIWIDSINISTLSEKQLDKVRGSQIGLVLQKSHFVAALTVLENIELACWLASGKAAKDKAKALLSELGLENHMRKFPSELSVGQQQRVSIARALINEPKMLLADEPTSSLDDTNAFLVADLLTNLSKEYGAALIIVTHDKRLKDKFSNQIILQ
jgi:ABC-type lipoprotein export system ATPase subunit